MIADSLKSVARSEEVEFISLHAHITAYTCRINNTVKKNMFDSAAHNSSRYGNMLNGMHVKVEMHSMIVIERILHELPISHFCLINAVVGSEQQVVLLLQIPEMERCLFDLCLN